MKKLSKKAKEQKRKSLELAQKVLKCSKCRFVDQEKLFKTHCCTKQGLVNQGKWQGQCSSLEPKIRKLNRR